MTVFKPWRFYVSPRGLYVIVVGCDGLVEAQIRRLSEDGNTDDIWRLADFLDHYNTKDMVEVANPFEGVSRIVDWTSYGQNNRGIKK